MTAPIPIDDPVFAPVVTALHEIDHRSTQRMKRVRNPDGADDPAAPSAVDSVDLDPSQEGGPSGGPGEGGIRCLPVRLLWLFPCVRRQSRGGSFRIRRAAKGRALVDLLASQIKLTARGKDPAAINRALDRLAHAEKADATVADPTAQSDSAGYSGHRREAEKELLAQDPELASITTVTDTDIKTIQARLGTDEVILEYYSTGRDWFAFVLKT